MAHESRRTALLLGATGGVGGAVAAALMAHGWQVRALARDGAAAAGRWDQGGAQPAWIAGDAMAASDVLAAAEGANVIVHAVNPPGYRNWGQLVLPMIANSIAAAEAVGARIVLPGTIYNFDPASQRRLVEDTPQQGRSRKGMIRVKLEAMLEQAAAERGVRSLIVRAGDFFGPRVKQSWFAQLMVRPGRPVSRIVTPGRERAGHSWAYLPDLAEAIARLLDAEDRLDTFERVHFDGHWDHDGQQMVAAIAEAAGRPGMGAWRFPWGLTTVAAPFSEPMREICEIGPFWRHEMRITGTRMAELIGAEPHTPLVGAVRASLAGLGCLDGGQAAGRPLDHFQDERERSSTWKMV